MSNIYQLPNKDELLDIASEWLAKLDRGLNVKEEAKLAEWLSDDPANRDMFFELAELWDKMESLSRLKDLFPQPVERPEQKPFSTRFAFASVVLVAVLASIFTLSNQSYFKVEQEQQTIANTEAEQHYQTNIGEKSTVMLADGSQLILNTNSAIKTFFTDDERQLYLERGEIHVQVAHDKSRPFKVYVGDKIVQAVGTEFNLEILDGQKIELIVTEGKVLVSVKGASTVAKTKIDNEQSKAFTNDNIISLTMVEGDKVILGSDEEKIEHITSEDIKVNLSWQGGNLIFRGESLENAIAEIERYTQVEFEIIDDDLKQVRVAGLFKAGDVNGLLETLEQNFNVTYRRIGSSKILLSSYSDKAH